MEQTLAALGNRVFLMNNVHDDGPTVFQSRWALSFLRGPLSRQYIQKLMTDRKQAVAATAPALYRGPASSTANAASPATTKTATRAATNAGRPILAADVPERFVEATRTAGSKSDLVYRPMLLGNASCHYVKAAADVDTWIDTSWVACRDGVVEDDVWSKPQR